MVIGAYVLKGDQAQPHDWLPVWTASNEFSRRTAQSPRGCRRASNRSRLRCRVGLVPFSEPVSKRDDPPS